MSYHTLASYYDSFTNNMDYQKRTDFICALFSDFLHVAPNKKTGSVSDQVVLDLACGTGKYSAALLQRGYDVIGIDASVEMLSIAREKCPSMLLLCQRLEELDLYGTAQAAICLTDSVNHITDPALVQRFFQRLALFMDPGAPFIFDINTLHKHTHVLANNTFLYENDEAVCVWHNKWLPEKQMTEITLDFGAQVERFCERVYHIEELTVWLNEAGFAIEQVMDAPGEEGERAFVVARRNKKHVA